MAKKYGDHDATERLVRELKQQIMEDRVAVFHGLYCPLCGRDPMVEPALALVGWGEVEFLHEVERRHGPDA